MPGNIYTVQQQSIQMLLTAIYNRCRPISFPLQTERKPGCLLFHSGLWAHSISALLRCFVARREKESLRAAQRNFAVYLGEIQNCFLPSRAENQLSKYSDVHKLYYKEICKELASFMLRNRLYLSFLESTHSKNITLNIFFLWSRFREHTCVQTGQSPL